MDDLAGRMAVVTGGGSGLGRPYAWATDSAVRILCWSSHALWRWCRSSAPICSKSSVSIARMLQAAVEQVFARDIEHAVAAHILVHDLFEPLKTLERADVARRDGSGDDLVSAHPVGFQRLEHGFFKPSDVLVVDLRRFRFVVHHVPDGRLRREPSFRVPEGVRRGAGAKRRNCATASRPPAAPPRS